jgi:hypothetical protein
VFPIVFGVTVTNTVEIFPLQWIIGYKNAFNIRSGVPVHSSLVSVENDMALRAHTISEEYFSFLYCMMPGLRSTPSIYDYEGSLSFVWTMPCSSCIGSHCGGDDNCHGEAFALCAEDVVIHAHLYSKTIQMSDQG